HEPGAAARGPGPAAPRHRVERPAAADPGPSGVARRQLLPPEFRGCTSHFQMSEPWVFMACTCPVRVLFASCSAGSYGRGNDGARCSRAAAARQPRTKGVMRSSAAIVADQYKNGGYSEG